MLQEVLARKLRWDDESYLSRMIFSAMIAGVEKDSTGYGISTYEIDNEHPLIHVNMGKQTVSIGKYTWTFEEYIADDLDKINF